MPRGMAIRYTVANKLSNGFAIAIEQTLQPVEDIRKVIMYPAGKFGCSKRAGKEYWSHRLKRECHSGPVGPLSDWIDGAT